MLLSACANFPTSGMPVDSSPNPSAAAFELRSPLQIGDRVVEGSITVEQIAELMGEKIPLGADDPKAYEFLSTPSGPVRVETCGEYFAAIADGAFAQSTFDMTMEGFFKRACNPLKYLQSATVPTQSYLPEFVLTDFDALPVILMRGINPDAAAQLEEDTAQGVTLADYIANTKLVITRQTPYELEVEEEGGMLFSWREVVRADFNGDGLEDVLVFANQNSMEGTFRSYSHLLLEKTEDGEGIYRVSALD